MLGHLIPRNPYSYGPDNQSGFQAQAMAAALELYYHARNRARSGRLWSVLTGRSNCLLKLAKVKGMCTMKGRHYAGLQMVPLSQIKGSEGRCQDFDGDFNPLREHNEERWLGIATARALGTPLPPVELIQVGDCYFIRDGHHRISVARALGQKEIEAEVAVWELEGPPPWEEPVSVEQPLPISNLVDQPVWSELMGGVALRSIQG